jgi:biopolymer transport protein ExbD
MAAVRADVSVTPLIDVMLVLLILFMVLAPPVHHSLDTNVPSPPAEEPPRPAPAAIVITVGPRLALNGQAIDGLADLRTRLETALVVRADRTVFVRSEGEVTYGRVVEVMDTARTAGAERLGLLTESGARSEAFP